MNDEAQYDFRYINIGVLSFAITMLILMANNGPIPSKVRECTARENTLYSERWAERCEAIGRNHSMCQLPDKHAEEIGFNDHVARSKACERLAGL